MLPVSYGAGIDDFGVLFWFVPNIFCGGGM